MSLTTSISLVTGSASGRVIRPNSSTSPSSDATAVDGNGNSKTSDDSKAEAGKEKTKNAKPSEFNKTEAEKNKGISVAVNDLAKPKDAKSQDKTPPTTTSPITGADLSKSVRESVKESWKNDANARDATGQQSTDGQSNTQPGNQQSTPTFESANKSVKGMSFEDLQRTFSAEGIEERTGFKGPDSSSGGSSSDPSSQAAQGAGPGGALAGALGGGLGGLGGGGSIINSFNTNSGNNGSFNTNSNVDSLNGNGSPGPREGVGETPKAPETATDVPDLNAQASPGAESVRNQGGY